MFQYVKIFADGANKESMLTHYENPLIQGFTTNPSILRKHGVANYEEFAKDILSVIKNKPISFEVIADEFDEMKRQALKIASWGSNVWVKIPITNTKGESSEMLIKDLNWLGVKLNVTAIIVYEQVENVFKWLPYKRGVYISVFAGRIADTGADYLSIMKECVNLLSDSEVKLIWASPRELYNLIQADLIGCDIITVTDDILKKIPLMGKDLKQYSLETVQLFYADALKSGYLL